MLFVILLVGVFFFGGMIALILWLWRRTASGTPGSPTRVNNARTAQEFLGFETVREGMIQAAPGVYRAVLEVQPISFWLKAPEEQRGILLAYKRVLDAQDEPFQIYVPSLRIDPREPAGAIRAASADAPPSYAVLGETLAAWVELYLGGRTLYRRSNYLILSYVFSPVPGRARPSEEEIRSLARRNLSQRIDAIAKGLKGTGLVVRRLDSEEIIDFLYAFYNRDRSRLGRLSESLSEGCLSPYVTGEMPDVQEEEAVSGGNDAAEGAAERAG